MSGRTEGGAVPPTCQTVTPTTSGRILFGKAQNKREAILHTPLCPAGHLPRKGGQRPSRQDGLLPHLVVEKPLLVQRLDRAVGLQRRDRRVDRLHQVRALRE